MWWLLGTRAEGECHWEVPTSSPYAGFLGIATATVICLVAKVWDRMIGKVSLTNNRFWPPFSPCSPRPDYLLIWKSFNKLIWIQGPCQPPCLSFCFPYRGHSLTAGTVIYGFVWDALSFMQPRSVCKIMIGSGLSDGGCPWIGAYQVFKQVPLWTMDFAVFLKTLPITSKMEGIRPMTRALFDGWDALDSYEAILKNCWNLCLH